MERIVIALFLVTAVLGATFHPVPTFPENATNRGRIIGGEDADISDYPAQLRAFTGDWSCGAVLITTTRAATVAHCMDGDTTNLQIIAGTSELLPNECTGMCQIRTVTDIHIHPDWVGGGVFPNNVATLHWAEALTTGQGVEPAIMAALTEDSGHEYWAGHECHISGWGLSSVDPDVTPDMLQWTDTTVISESDCQIQWGAGIGNSHICSGNFLSSTCIGDSGGPLTCRQGLVQPWYLVGLIAFGHGNCALNVSQVHTSIPYFRNWILANI